MTENEEIILRAKFEDLTRKAWQWNSFSRDAQTGINDSTIVKAAWYSFKYGFGMGQEDASATRDDGMPKSKTERQLRRMLCAQRHGAKAYMDDGEASFGGDESYRSIDYMRESLESIEAAWRKAEINQFKVAVDQSECSTLLRLAGKPYPRTCKVCGLGPCKNTDVSLIS